MQLFMLNKSTLIMFTSDGSSTKCSKMHDRLFSRILVHTQL